MNCNKDCLHCKTIKSKLAELEQLECFFNQLQELNRRMKSASCKGVQCYQCPLRISNQIVSIKTRDNIEIQVLCISNLIDTMLANSISVMLQQKYDKMIKECILEKGDTS